VNREQANLIVNKFNRSNLSKKGKAVLYLKSELEGKVKALVSKEAYILDDNIPVCELKGIGIAQLDKIEPYWV
jgi:hypothetical protein